MSIDYKKVYNIIYESSSVYADSMDDASGRQVKNPFIFSAIEAFSPKTLVDLGCGQGYYVRHLRNEKNIDAVGVEVSNYCCEKYLQDVPHSNADLKTFLSSNPKYDFLFCTDVFEHIGKNEISTIVKLSSNCAPVALYGVANHSDIQHGIELHVIRKPAEWWIKLLSKYYSNVKLTGQLYDGRFFFILCIQDNQRLKNILNNYIPPASPPASAPASVIARLRSRISYRFGMNKL